MWKWKLENNKFHGKWQISKRLSCTRRNMKCITRKAKYLKSFSCSMSSRISIHLSSSGIWRASIETGSSHSVDHPRSSDNLRAWIFKNAFGTRAHWWGFRNWVFNLGGNYKVRVTKINLSENLYVHMSWVNKYIYLCTCGVKCFPELSNTADDNGNVVGVLPSSNCNMSLLVASTNTAGNNFVPGSI